VSEKKIEQLKLTSHIITCLVTSTSSIHQRPYWVLFIVAQDCLFLCSVAVPQGATSTESTAQSKKGLCSYLLRILKIKRITLKTINSLTTENSWFLQQNVREYVKYIKRGMTHYSWTFQYVDYENSPRLIFKVKTQYFVDTMSSTLGKSLRVRTICLGRNVYRRSYLNFVKQLCPISIWE
jgi:hypothetical protein